MTSLFLLWLPSACPSNHLQALHVADGMLQVCEAVVSNVQRLQASQAVQACRQGCQAVVLQDEGLQISASA